jgi:phosphotransferase family enzyme
MWTPKSSTSSPTATLRLASSVRAPGLSQCLSETRHEPVSLGCAHGCYDERAVREVALMTSIATSAAIRVAASYGYKTEDPVLLQETNNTVVWLRPHAIIAKVGKWRHSDEALVREHAIAVALAAIGAPIAPPLSGVDPAHDQETGLIVTLWTKLDHDLEREVAPTDVGMSLRRLQHDLARYEGELRSFQAKLSLARAALADDRLMSALPIGDRSMLRAAFDRLRAEVDTYGYIEQPLHGEPHRGNLLATSTGLRWIDLEGVCVGPPEWDLAFLPEEALSPFPVVDFELLGLLRTLNSARVATWCWQRSEFDEMRRHGEYHLEQVRRAGSS